MRIAGTLWYALALSSVVTATTGAALADDAADEHERTLQRGVELRRLGKNAEALAAFETAYALEPSPRVGAQIALARQALGDWVGAERGLEEALAAGADPWIASYRGALEQALATVRAHLGSVQVETNVPDAEVAVGGGPALALPLTRPLRLPAGTTSIEVRSHGYPPEQRTVTVEPGTTVRVAVVLAPSSAPGAEVAPAPVRRDAVVHPPPPRASRVPAYLALGTAGVLATTGVVAWRVRENLVAIYNDNSRCRVGALTRAEQCAGWSQGADVALGVEVGAFVGAGIAAALGGWALLRAPGRAPSATFWCAPWTGAGVTCARTF